VFQGIKRASDHAHGQFGWTCYVGRPDRCFEDDGSQFPPPPRQVFVAFVTDHDVVYNWAWVKSDPADADLPEDHGARFDRRIK
jgi:hypothetical protein